MDDSLSKTFPKRRFAKQGPNISILISTNFQITMEEIGKSQ